MKTLIVTGSDREFFPLLQEMVRSVRDSERGSEVALGVIDAGLDREQRSWIEARADEVVEPGWDLREPDGAPDYVKCFDSRVLLPRYFPGFDVYLWIDADAWIQDWAAVELYVRAANTGAMAIAAEIHAAFRPVLPELRVRYRKFGRIWIESWAHHKYRLAYGLEAMREHAFRPVLNAGVFALRSDAPHWAAWEQSYREALKRAAHEWLSQIACNHALYSNGLAAHLLPARCNWPCSRGMPAFDLSSGLLVEPYLPHDPIGIVHMTWTTKEGEHDLATTDGGRVRRSLRYPASSSSSAA